MLLIRLASALEVSYSRTEQAQRQPGGVEWAFTIALDLRESRRVIMLRISTSDFAKMRGECERAYPREACGVLLGTNSGDVREVRAVVPCGNEHTHAPEKRYRISPKELIAAQKQARDAGGEIVGFYHSHPDCPARWSPTDLAEAHWLGCSYVITSVETGLATRTYSFVLPGSSEEDKHFEDEEVEVR